MHRSQWFIDWMARGRAWLEEGELVPHPLKALSRRFLGVGLGLSLALHLAALGLLLLLRWLGNTPTVPLRLAPYTSYQVDVIPTSSLVTTESGGGGGGGTPGGTPPPGPGDDIRSLGAPKAPEFITGVPVPVPDNTVAESQPPLATQEQLSQTATALVVPDAASTAGTGMGGTGGGGTGTGGVGGGIGSGGGGGGGDGPPGTWRYDTPPNPRRLITSVQPKSLRDVEGTVKFRLLIDEFGTVVDAVILESSRHHALDELALAAVRKSLFNPATFRGRTVKAWIVFGYGFKVAKR